MRTNRQSKRRKDKEKIRKTDHGDDDGFAVVGESDGGGEDIGARERERERVRVFLSLIEGWERKGE